MKRISVSDLGNVVGEMLDEYREYTAENVKGAVKAVSKKVVQEIAETAPKNTGRYAKSWKAKVTDESYSDIHVTVHSPTDYQLAHLLEHGHAKRNGGRTRAFPHIAPAEEHAEMMLEEELANRLKG